jgi:hypothetical protein
LVTEDDIRFALAKAKEVCEEFRTFYPDHPEILSYFPRSVDNLEPVIEKRYGCKINVRFPRIKTPHQTLVGYCILANTSDGLEGNIFIDYDQNFCWRRFIQCKEMFQVVVDRPEGRTTDYENQLKQLNPQFPFQRNYVASIASEDMAEVAAMEFLFPYLQRKVCIAKDLGYMAVAKQYRVPQSLVSRFLSESYMDILGRFTL